MRTTRTANAALNCVHKQRRHTKMATVFRPYMLIFTLLLTHSQVANLNCQYRRKHFQNLSQSQVTYLTP